MYILWQIIRFILTTFVITTLVDIILMGMIFPKFAKKTKFDKFFVSPRPDSVKTDDSSWFEFQGEGGCAGFSSAFVLRFLGEKAAGNEIFKQMPATYGNGIAFPKSITRYFKKRGVKVKACMGNLAALKNEISLGKPVIVVIRSFVGKSFLHFACITGYDEEFIYFADSIKDWVNVNDSAAYYNRKVPVEEFKKLWNTSMLKMPLYFNIYYQIR